MNEVLGERRKRKLNKSLAARLNEKTEPERLVQEPPQEILYVATSATEVNSPRDSYQVLRLYRFTMQDDTLEWMGMRELARIDLDSRWEETHIRNLCQHGNKIAMLRDGRIEYEFDQPLAVGGEVISAICSYDNGLYFGNSIGEFAKVLDPDNFMGTVRRCITSMEVHDSGTYIGCEDGKVFVYPSSDPKRLKHFISVGKLTESVIPVDLSISDLKIHEDKLYVASQSSVLNYDLNRPVANKIYGSTDMIYSLANFNGVILAGGQKGDILDISSGKTIFSFDGPEQITAMASFKPKLADIVGGDEYRQ